MVAFALVRVQGLSGVLDTCIQAEAKYRARHGNTSLYKGDDGMSQGKWSRGLGYGKECGELYG